MTKTLLLAALACAGCTTIERTRPEIPGPGGRKVEHIYVSKFAVHFAIKLPFMGDARFRTTADETLAWAREHGAKNIEIVRSETTNYWLAIFPFTLLITPVISEISANIEVP